MGLAQWPAERNTNFSLYIKFNRSLFLIPCRVSTSKEPKRRVKEKKKDNNLERVLSRRLNKELKNKDIIRANPRQ